MKNIQTTRTFEKYCDLQAVVMNGGSEPVSWRWTAGCPFAKTDVDAGCPSCSHLKDGAPSETLADPAEPYPGLPLV